MLKSMVKRAPFKGVPLDEIKPSPDHKYIAWRRRGLAKAVIDKDGLVVRLCWENMDVVNMAEEMNMRAAQAIMVEDTPADPNWNSDMWKAFKP